MIYAGLCHSHAGAAVQCDPRLIPITTPGIDHISFVVTDGLPRGLLVFEPSHLASRPARTLFSQRSLKYIL